MDWQEALYRWEDYAEKLYTLRDEVAGIFETKSFYDDKWEYHEKFYTADEDTVFLLKLFEKMNDICDFIKSHIMMSSSSTACHTAGFLRVACSTSKSS